MCRRRTPLAVCLLLLLLAAPAANAQELQTWTDVSGKHKTQAEFVRVDGQSVVLRKADGTEVPVPLSKLNAASRQQAKAAADAQNVMNALAPAPRATSPRRQAQSQGSPSMPSAGPNAGSSSSSAVTSSGPPPNVDAKTFVDSVVAEYKQTESLAVIWNAMPVSYQSDIEGLVRLFGQKYDPALATEIDSLKKRLVSLLKSKKQFVLNSSLLAAQPQAKEPLTAFYDPAVAAVDAVLATDLLTPANLQKMPLPQLVEQYGKRIKEPTETLSDKMKEMGIYEQAGMNVGTIDQLDYTVVQNDATHATITMKHENGEEETQRLVAVEGRWVPEGMPDNWKENIARARQALEQLTPQQQKEIATQMKMMAGQMLAGLEAAKTQQEFDEAVGGVMAMAMMMGGGMGGPPGQLGGPGGGFGPGFGPPGGPGGNPEFNKEDFSVPFE